MNKVLISDRTHPVLEERLRDAGFVVSVEPDHDYENLIAAAQSYDGLVVRSKVNIDRAFIDRVPSLRCIGRVGAGMETIDVEYAESKGIRCLNSPEGNRDAVGEHTVGLLLALLNRQPHRRHHRIWQYGAGFRTPPSRLRLPNYLL